MSRTLLNIRYGIIALHTLLWLITLPLSLSTTGSLLLLIFHAMAGLALLIYIPAAVYLALKDSPSTFDHAGGEIAYVTVQLALWLASALAALLLHLFSETQCHDGFSIHPYSYYRGVYPDSCWAMIITWVFSFVQVVLMSVWLGVVVHTARRSGMPVKEAYRVPVHRLLVRSHRREEGYGMDDMGEGGGKGDVERAKKVVEDDD